MVSWLGWIIAVLFGFVFIFETLRDFSNPWDTITIGVKSLGNLVFVALGVVMILGSRRKRS